MINISAVSKKSGAVQQVYRECLQQSRNPGIQPVKVLQPFQWNVVAAATQVSAFKILLRTHSIGETGPNGLLEFFKKSKDLLGILGYFNPGAGRMTHWASDLDVNGLFRTDFAIGSEKTGRYALIEFEPGKDCIFKKQGNKFTSEWHSQFNHGYNQLLDWLWAFDDFSYTNHFASAFPNLKEFQAILVIGRKRYLSKEEKQRLEWRQSHTVINNTKLMLITFDDLLSMLETEIKGLRQHAKQIKQ